MLSSCQPTNGAMKPLHERRDDETRGRHLVAARPIDAGSVIFAEKPLLCLQSVGNAHAGALTCRCCRCFVGGPNLSLAVASGRVKREQAIDYWEAEIRAGRSASLEQGSVDGAGRDDAYAIVPCRNNCGELFCSAKCEEDTWTVGGHCLLCTGLIPESGEGGVGSDQLHPLLQFKIHAVQSNEILLMVADLIASVISTLCRRMDLEEEQGDPTAGNNAPLPTLDEIIAPYLDFTLVPWWKVATAPLLSSPIGFSEAAQLDSALRQICTESSTLLKEAIMSTVSASSSHSHSHSLRRAITEIEEKYDVFTPTFFSKIIGSFEQNALGVRARHPLCRDVFNKELRVQCHEDLIRCIEAAGMIGDDAEEEEEGGEAGKDEEKEREEESNNCDDEDKNADVERGGEEAVEGESEEYSVSEIAGFIAGLDIDEENAGLDKEKPNDKEDVMEEDNGDDLDALFIPLDGTAMYYTTCKMNHSCCPNVVARYRYSCSANAGGQWGSAHPLAVECVALRDIKEGEELAISYIQSDEPLDKRTAELANYGFACNCSKCKAEKRGDGGEDAVTINVPECEEMPDPFGSDDEDDPFGSDSDDDKDDAVETTQGGEDMLERRVLGLNNEAGSSLLGRLPLQILAKSSSYVIKTGGDVLDDVSDVKRGVSDNGILEYIESIHTCLREVMKSLQAREFVGCFSSAVKGEALSLSLLYSNGSWPHASLRAAYWCLALSLAIANADAGNFISALAFLDKAIIFGLPKECVKQLMEYVEYHSSTNLRIKVYLRFGLVNDCQSEGEDTGHVKDALRCPTIEHPMKSASEVTKNDFDCKYVSESHPLVIRGLAASWPAIEKWRDMDFWANAHGHRLVPIELGDMQRGGMKEQIVRLDRFVSSYLKPSSEKACWSLEMATSVKEKSQVAYLAQHQLFEQIPELMDDIITPSLCGEAGPTHVNAWIGTGGTRTPLHFDSYDNLFVQVVGSKYVRIYEESETDKLYVLRTNDATSSYGAQGNMSAINCELEDFDAHPAVRNAKYTEIIMRPGDCLFIPARAWHYVRSFSTSVSVNFWF